MGAVQTVALALNEVKEKLCSFVRGIAPRKVVCIYALYVGKTIE